MHVVRSRRLRALREKGLAAHETFPVSADSGLALDCAKLGSTRAYFSTPGFELIGCGDRTRERALLPLLSCHLNGTTVGRPGPATTCASPVRKTSARDGNPRREEAPRGWLMVG